MNRDLPDHEPATRDPVCGTLVTGTNRGAPAYFQGVRYFFCCTDCLMKFVEDPEKYTEQRVVASPSLPA